MHHYNQYRHLSVLYILLLLLYKSVIVHREESLELFNNHIDKALVCITVRIPTEAGPHKVKLTIKRLSIATVFCPLC